MCGVALQDMIGLRRAYYGSCILRHLNADHGKNSEGLYRPARGDGGEPTEDNPRTFGYEAERDRSASSRARRRGAARRPIQCRVQQRSVQGFGGESCGPSGPCGLLILRSVDCRGYSSSSSRGGSRPTRDLARKGELRISGNHRCLAKPAQFLGELQGHTIPAKGWGNSTVERSDAFAARAIKWWKATILAHVASLPDAAAEGANADAVARVLVVSHGGFINVLIQGLVGARHARCAPGVKTGLSCVNTAVCEVEVEGEKGIVLRYGDVSHLTERVEQPNADIFAEP